MVLGLGNKTFVLYLPFIFPYLPSYLLFTVGLHPPGRDVPRASAVITNDTSHGVSDALGSIPIGKKAPPFHKTPPFGLQKVAFQALICHLSETERAPFETWKVSYWFTESYEQGSSKNNITQFVKAVDDIFGAQFFQFLACAVAVCHTHGTHSGAVCHEHIKLCVAHYDGVCLLYTSDAADD